MDSKKVYTITELAKSLGVCKNTVRKLMAEGRIVSVRISARKILIPADSVERFLQGE